MFVGYVGVGKVEKWLRNVALGLYWVLDGGKVIEDGQTVQKMAGEVSTWVLSGFRWMEKRP